MQRVKETGFERNKVSIRQTFDGSVNEKEPASFTFLNNNKSGADFFNIDLAVKITEWDLNPDGSNNIFLLYPVAEWHKSINEEDEKDKLSTSLNAESLLFKSKFYSLISFKYLRNFLDNVNELKFTGRITYLGSGDRTYLPGVSWKFKNANKDFAGLYYPYLGYEYNIIPDLITEGDIERLSMWFFRLYLEWWISPREIQFITDGIYRNSFGKTNLTQRELPFIGLSLNWYPLKQDDFSIGINYKNGYDPDSRYQEIEITSITANFKFN